MTLAYPPAPLRPVVEDYHGTPVVDPYRWLEDIEAPETRAWVAAENALTRAWLDGPTRDAIRARLVRCYDVPRLGVPLRRGHRYFYTYNPGLLAQPILYVREGARGADRVLVDPNALSPDGTVALTALEPDRRGRLLVYGLSAEGSDWQELRVRDVDRSDDLPDRLRWVKFASVAWLADGSGFFYTRFPAPGTVPPGEEHYHARVSFHRLGDDQAKDQLVVARPDDPNLVFELATTSDGRWLVITVFQGASDRSEVYLLDLRTGGPPVPIFAGFTALYDFVGFANGRLYFRTDAGAPRGRVVAVVPPDVRTGQVRPPDGSADRPTTAAGHAAALPDLIDVVPESDDTLTHAVLCSRWIAVAALHHASHRLRLFHLDGRPAAELPLPAYGTILDLSSEPDEEELLVGWTSFTDPPRAYGWRPGETRLEPFLPPHSARGENDLPGTERPSATAGAAESRAARQSSHRTDRERYRTERVQVPSPDGTSVPMFLVSARDRPADGPRPTLLTGYGGFGVNMTPVFDPAVFVWLDAGGVYALAALRGGGEYGELWHRAGMGPRKQTVFDDFTAAAEWLIATGRTTPRRLAIDGASNGGLLVAACLVQRPDLFGAVVCRVPVVDMLRYHRFTVGRFWIPEYGCADDPEAFRVLYHYSPYHRVRDGIDYPATLIATAEGDDRVHPGMAYKFAARLQAASAGERPILLRVEPRAGHGAGKPVWKQIDEDADVLAFLFRVFALPPPSGADETHQHA